MSRSSAHKHTDTATVSTAVTAAEDPKDLLPEPSSSSVPAESAMTAVQDAEQESASESSRADPKPPAPPKEAAEEAKQISDDQGSRTKPKQPVKTASTMLRPTEKPPKDAEPKGGKSSPKTVSPSPEQVRAFPVSTEEILPPRPETTAQQQNLGVLVTFAVMVFMALLLLGTILVQAHARRKQEPLNKATVPPDTCLSSECRNISNSLRTLLDDLHHPCDDFYAHVCSKYRGPHKSVFAAVEAKTYDTIKSLLRSTVVPEVGQTSFQKAAGMFQACLDISRTSDIQMRDLRAWLASQRLDFFDLREDSSYDPVEALVQFSIVYGLPALLTFDVSRTGFINKTRMIKFMLYDKDITWYVGRHLSKSERTSNQLANPFLTYLSSYGLAGEELRSMVTDLESYAGQVVTIAYGFLQQKFEFSTVQIKDLGKLTEGRITSEQWISIFLKLTEGYYSAIEPLMVLNTAPLFLVKLLEAPGVGRHGLRCLIAWSVLRRVGDLLEGAERPEAAGVLEHVCFEHVRLVMEPALMKEYMKGTVHTESLMKARNVTLSIKEAFKNVITHSSWMQNETREVALQKLAKMPVFVGFPGNIPDANSVEDHYGRLSDSSASRFFHDWRVALEQFSRQLFRDQKHAWFPLAEAKAFYLATNAIGVAAAALQPPFFYGAGPASYNFGALGTAVAHNIMHAFDAGDSNIDDAGNPGRWIGDEVTRQYVNKSLCLRKSYQYVGLKVGSDRDNGGWNIDWGLPGYIDAFNGLLWAKEAIAAPRQEKRERRLPDQSRSLKQVSLSGHSGLPDDKIDSENLADFAGLLLATEALQALPEQEMSLRLPELPLSAEQLFFVAHCLRWCGLVANDTDVAHHAPRRFRCNVPLMNSEAFARAFQCPAGSTMNPENKCAFW